MANFAGGTARAGAAVFLTDAPGHDQVQLGIIITVAFGAMQGCGPETGGFIVSLQEGCKPLSPPGRGAYGMEGENARCPVEPSPKSTRPSPRRSAWPSR